MKKICLTLAVLTLAFVSCKKNNDDDKTCAVTQESLAGSYKLTSFTINGIDAQDAYFETCQQDDVVTLKADGTYEYLDAGVTCDPDGSTEGNWSLTGNQLSIDYLPVDLNVESFDCTNLTGTGSFGGFTASATFVKQ